MSNPNEQIQDTIAAKEFGFCGASEITGCTDHPLAKQMVESCQNIAPMAGKSVGGIALGYVAGGACGALIGGLVPLITETFGMSVNKPKGKTHG